MVGQVLLQWVLPLALTAAGIGVAWLAKRGHDLAADYVRAHVTNLRVQTLLLKADDFAESVVGALAQTVVADLKEESRDGKLSTADGARIKQDAIDRIKSMFGAEWKDYVDHVGAGSEERAAATLDHKVEAAVAAQAADSAAPPGLTRERA